MEGIYKREARKGEKWITHYCSTQRILLVGEGDFSFSACLARSFGSARNMVATSRDSEEELMKKHWSSVPHLEELKRLGCPVLHEVDVENMDEHLVLGTMRFDRIVFNFPHAGHFPHLCEHDNELIQLHKKLLSGFFESARRMLREEGEVHVAHRDDYPYNRWNLKKLAKKAGLFLIEPVEFRKADYPGYHNKRGGGIKSNQKFPLGECFTFKFSLKKCSEKGTDNTRDDRSCTTELSEVDGHRIDGVLAHLCETLVTLILQQSKDESMKNRLRRGKH